MPPLFQILAQGENARRLDQLGRAEERGAVARSAAQHDQRRGSGNDLRHLLTRLLHGGGRGVHNIGQGDKLLAQGVRPGLRLSAPHFAQLNRHQQQPQQAGLVGTDAG